MADAPNRHWLRFSLRTLLVGVTVSALLIGWLTHRLNWIEQRQHFIDQWRERGGHAISGAAPWQLRILGALGIETFEYGFFEDDPHTTDMLVLDDADRANIARLFPEARVESVSRW